MTIVQLRRTAAVLMTMFVLACVAASAQNMATAIGPGTYAAVGGEVSFSQADYGRRYLGGGTAYMDLNPTWRYGFEAEARYLRIHTDEDVTETNFLVGPRVMVRPGPFRPYGKFLVGAGKISLPFHYAQGTFFTYAPGAGVDYIAGDRLTIRVIDFEYQLWTDFGPYGQLHTYGLSTGFSVRLNPREHFPKNASRARWH